MLPSLKAKVKFSLSTTTTCHLRPTKGLRARLSSNGGLVSPLLSTPKNKKRPKHARLEVIQFWAHAVPGFELSCRETWLTSNFKPGSTTKEPGLFGKTAQTGEVPISQTKCYSECRVSWILFGSFILLISDVSLQFITVLYYDSRFDSLLYFYNNFCSIFVKYYLKID